MLLGLVNQTSSWKLMLSPINGSQSNFRTTVEVTVVLKSVYTKQLVAYLNVAPLEYLKAFFSGPVLPRSSISGDRSTWRFSTG